MAVIHNEQRALGIRLVTDGETMHNGLPVIGVKDATGETFVSDKRVLGVAVLTTPDVIHNDQPVRGAVLIADGRALYNFQPVIPVDAVSGALV